jgi:hypothetical protein
MSGGGFREGGTVISHPNAIRLTGDKSKVSGPNKRRPRRLATKLATLCALLSLALLQQALALKTTNAHNFAGAAASASDAACRSDASREAPSSDQGHSGDPCPHCLAAARALLSNLLPVAIAATVTPPAVLRIVFDRAGDRQLPSPVEAVPWSSRAPPFFS